MKKTLAIGTLFFAFFVATPATAKARLDSEGKNYWTIEVKKPSKNILNHFKDIMLLIQGVDVV